MNSKLLIIYCILCSGILSGCQSLGDVFGYQTNLNIINPKYFDNRYYDGNNRHIPYGNIEELDTIANKPTKMQTSPQNMLVQKATAAQMAQNNIVATNTQKPLVIDDSVPVQKSNNIFTNDQLIYSSGQDSLKTLNTMIEATDKDFVPPISTQLGITQDTSYQTVDDLIIQDTPPKHKKSHIPVHKVSKTIEHKKTSSKPKSSKADLFEDVPLE